MNDNFKFFVPLDFEKSKDPADAGKMIVTGVASTRDIDSDKEVLEPEGFDLSRFLKSGYINYNHKSKDDPKAIIGEPISAWVKDGKLMIKGELYADSQKAIDVYDTALMLQKSSKTRRLGYSIEGRATERDPANPKRIIKAAITGCAITPTPKNTSTLVEIMKGHVDDFSYEYDLIKGEDSNGGAMTYIVDVVDEASGIRRTIDQDLNIRIERAMGTAEMAPTMPESVEHGRKPLKNNDFFQKNSKNLTKAEVYGEIFRMFTPDINKAKKIHALLEQIENKINPNMDPVISEETLQKAQDILDLAASEVEKSANAKDGLIKAEEEVARLTDELTKAVAAVTAEQKKFPDAGLSSEDQGQDDEDGGKIDKNPAKGESGGKQKSVHAAHTTKSDDDDLNKGEKDDLNKTDDNLVDLIKGLEATFDKKLSSLGELYEAEREENEDLKKSIEGLTDKVSSLEGAPAGPRKSVLSKSAIERFADEHPTGKVFSLTRNKEAVVDMLFDLSGIEKGVEDKELSKACQDVEAASWMEPKVQERLKKEHNIMIVQ